MSDSNGTPRAPEAEKQVVASVLLLPEILPEVSAIVRPFDFFEARERATYQAIHDLHAAGKPIEHAMLVDRLRGLPDFGTENPAGYLMELVQSVATAAHAPQYAKEVRDKRERRDRIQQLMDWGDQYRNGHATGDVDKDLFAAATDWQREREAVQPSHKFAFADLHSKYPALKPILIDGLARYGEVINIIANPKVGKSWFAYYLALCIITGRPLFGRFTTTPSRVLIIDNELHPETLSHRVPVVASAMGIDRGEYGHELDVWTLRGNLRSLNEVADDLEAIDPQTYGLILFDAKYRFATAGQSENDNASEAIFYNRADQIAKITGAAIAFIHHASKGSQSDKRASDVGSGAGAQSRAADVHAIFREHEDDGAFVFEALVRSFAPIAPIGLRWIFPMWTTDDDVDPSLLRGRLKPSEQRQNDKDREGINKIVDALRKDGPATARQLRARTGLSRERQQRLLDSLTADDLLTTTEIKHRGNVTTEYSLPKDQSPTSDE